MFTEYLSKMSQQPEEDWIKGHQWHTLTKSHEEKRYSSDIGGIYECCSQTHKQKGPRNHQRFPE